MGPLVGTKFPPEDYVAIPIGHQELYVSWLDPANFATVERVRHRLRAPHRI
jgi:hypothetical protein